MRAHGQEGFTLVEVLIALALTGLVALLALSGTRLAALGLDRVAAAAQGLEERRNLEALLRREISAAVASPLANRAPLAGTPQRIEFLSLAEDGGAGLYRVTLDVEASALVLRRSRVGSAAVPNRPPSVAAMENAGTCAGPNAAWSISRRSAKEAPTNSLWGSSRGRTNTTSSTRGNAVRASCWCAMVMGLNVPGSTPRREGRPGARRKNSI